MQKSRNLANFWEQKGWITIEKIGCTEWFQILYNFLVLCKLRFLTLEDYRRQILLLESKNNLAMLGLKNQNREKLRIFQNKQNETLWSTGPPECILTGEDWPFKNGHSSLLWPPPPSNQLTYPMLFIIPTLMLLKKPTHRQGFKKF